LGILEKLIAKEREDRYEELASMVEDLRNVTSKIDIEPSEFELPAPIPSQSIAVLPFVNINKILSRNIFVMD